VPLLRALRHCRRGALLKTEATSAV
jgi:hypothetical protein